jgi:hypothetical protein
MSTKGNRQQHRISAATIDKSNESGGIKSDTATKFDTDPEEFAVPLKSFDGTKKVISDVNE